jgi:hypothetical protein
MESRDYLAAHRSMPREDLAVWLLRRRRERFTAQLMAVLAVMVGGDTARREFAEMGQDDQRCRSWTNKWLARQGLNLKQARNLEAARWLAATRGTIGLSFAEMEALFAGIRPEMLWNFDELTPVRGGRADPSPDPSARWQSWPACRSGCGRQ